MTHTISSTYSTLVSLSGTADNPATITTTGLLEAGLNAASLSEDWTVTNAGSVLGAGVVLDSAGTVVNDGSIAAAGTGTGVSLLDGGLVSNAANETISSDHGVGIFIGATGTVTNAGIVMSGVGIVSLVHLQNGGLVSNAVGGTISSGGHHAIYVSGSAGTVLNGGLITSIGTTDSSAIALEAAGYVSNAAGATVSSVYGIGLYGKVGAVTVSNDGLITSMGSSGRAVELELGGSVTNATSAMIVASYDGISMIGGLGTVINYGSIKGVGGNGVFLNTGGSVTNAAAALIVGALRPLEISGGAGMVLNDGNVVGTGTSSIGVKLASGGSVTNTASATITGAIDGVLISGGGSVVDAGTISGGTYAVNFSAGFANVLVVDPGAVFTGLVNGGNTVGASTVSTLELASASSVGTLTGLGTKYIDFAQVTIDTGASWVLAGSNTNAPGATLTDSGTFTVASYFANSGSIAGKVILAGGATLANLITGVVNNAVGNAIYSAASSAGVSVINAGVVSDSSTASSAIGLHGGGYVSNAATGTINSSGRTSLYITGAAGTVLNAGIIITSGGTHGTVDLFDGGYVSNAATGTVSSSGDVGVDVTGGAGTVSNAGVIVSFGAHSAVVLDDGGGVTNQAGGTITATGGDAVYVGGGIGTDLNTGLLAGGTGDGVQLKLGGYVSNAAAGIISAKAVVSNAVYIGGELGTVINAGVITNSSSVHAAVNLRPGGYVDNLSTGTISARGHAAVYVYGGAGTVINAGTIMGIDGADAVDFVADFTNRLVADPGAVFISGVNGGNTVGASGVSTLELASGASSGTLSGLGSHYINFAQTTIDVGASWTLSGASDIFSGQTLTNAGTLKLFAASLTDAGALVNDGIINIDPSTLIAGGITGVGTIDIGANSTLTVGGPVAAGETIEFTGTNGVFNILDPSGFAGTILNKGPTDQVNLACFAEATRIRTERGAVAVEALVVGDRVPVVMGGGTQPIVWLGYRRVDCRRQPEPTQVWPIRLCAGAFGPGRPYRDLVLSPDHAVFVGGVLVPIHRLMNGRTIRQEARDEVTYWHVELAEHNVLYAEGVPAESYLDTGNRSAFANGGGVLDLHPDFGREVWETRSCAPLVLDGPRLMAARRRLLVRAAALGHRVTDNPDLRILADGGEVVASREGRTLRARLPEGTRTVRLVSRAWRPADMQPAADDSRWLGVAIGRVRLDGRAVGLDELGVGRGWHAPEGEWCWTDGDGSIAVGGARELALEVMMGGSYWVEEEGREARVA